jgi:hypothetical protein
VPVPENPEERAALAPEVLEFRRNQLRAPQQESNPLAALGAVALGAGALVGGIGLASRLGLGAAKTATPTQVNFTPKGVKDVSTIGRKQAAESLEREARQERPQGIVQADLSRSVMPTEAEAMQSYATQLSEMFPEPTSSEMEALSAPSRTARILARLGTQPQYRPDPKDINYARFGPVSKEVAEARRTQATEDLLRFAQQRQEDAALGATQTLGALESGEDQMTARVMRGVQRNEDLDVSEVNQIVRQTGNANVAASMTPDGVPVDQTDVWGEATLPILAQEGQQYGPEPLRLLPAATQGRQQQAQSFLTQKRQELSGQFGPTRTERILSENPELLEAVELYAITGDPNVLSRFSTAPSTPVTVKPTVQMGINTEEFPTGQFYKQTGYPEYVGDLLERDIELTNEISSIGLQQQQLAAKAQELGEQELMLRAAMDRDPEGGGAYTKMFGQVKYQQQNLPEPASLNVDLGDALAERDFVRGQMASLESLGPTYKLGDFQEGVRPFYEYDPQGNIIPQTLELRGGRRSVDLEPKTGGGRLVAEYDPAGQTGSTRGAYGVEQTSRRSGESTRPTQMTMNELVREGIEQATASPEGDVPIPPSLEQMTERRPTAEARRSIESSQALRQATIEGRDPQNFLAKQMQDLGISAIGEFSPWPRRPR